MHSFSDLYAFKLDFVCVQICVSMHTNFYPLRIHLFFSSMSVLISLHGHELYAFHFRVDCYPISSSFIRMNCEE